MRSLSSSVSPDHDSTSITSSDVIMPRSPWLASAAWTKKAGVPVEASVAAILRATWPDLPMPVTMTRPRAWRMVSTAAAKRAPRPSDMAAASAVSPPDSVANVRSAEATWGLSTGVGFLASDALIFARVLTRNSGLELSPRRWRGVFSSLIAPGGKGISESAIAGRTLFQCQNGTAAIVIDDRNIEPRPALEQLNIALQVGIDRGQADQEEAVGDFHGKARKRGAARLLGFFHQNAGHIGDAAAGKVGRQIEHDLDRMARRKRLVGITAQRPGDGHVLFGNFDIRADLEFRRKPGAGRYGFGAPNGGADELLALRVVRIFLIEHDALGDRGTGLAARRGAGRRAGALVLRHASGEFRLRRRGLRRLGLP